MRYELPEVLTRVAFKVDFYRGEDGWWIAECEGVPGAVTQGETLEEAREMIRDALGLMLEDYSEGEARQLAQDIEKRYLQPHSENLTVV